MQMKPGQRTGRRQPCPCGSRKRYKSCCFAEDREAAEKLGKWKLFGYWVAARACK